MSDRLRPVERTLAVWWVIATVIGWGIGFAVCQAIKSIISTVFVDGLVIGTFVGLAQWTILRRRSAGFGLCR